MYTFEFHPVMILLFGIFVVINAVGYYLWRSK